MPLLRVAFMVAFCAWVAVEFGLLARDRVRGMGSTSRDKGTRVLTSLAFFVAIAAAYLVTALLRSVSSLQLGRWHLIAGFLAVCAGLAIRIWAVLQLGSSFRTTVEADVGQAVVDRGPYRWVRHPSYAGLHLIAIGIGLELGNVPALAILALLPLTGTLRRITVEEALLSDVMGAPYAAYQERTKRLVPWVW